MNQQARTQHTVTPQAVKQRTSPIYLFLAFILIVVTAPYRRAFKLYTWQPLRELRAVKGDRKIFIPLVRNWKADKYAELQSVQVAVSRKFVSLFMPLGHLLRRIQTKSILDDLPAREQLDESLPEAEVQRMRRAILRYKKRPGIKHWVMLFIWQFPSMTMAYAWVTYLSGLTVYICTPFIQKMAWQDQHKGRNVV
ncbi:hypothetical protein N0V83_002974 [Neocucurbitaria cava]|uniref:Glycosyl-4,4'-diaponeurosporenoate acyltransferase n=1 Tax=Neocucurbitaria cava TaxID=798079 RepID=A0A9W8YDQ1_9PLEO|nr:hypothetical protein N0V83_002974 [Neocucurbitaria cava]